MNFGNGIQKFNRFKFKKYSDALDKGNGASTGTPSQSTCDEMIDHAILLRNEGQHYEAIDILELVAESGSHNSVQLAAYELGLLYSQLGNHIKADKHLHKLGFTVKLTNQILCPGLDVRSITAKRSKKDPVVTVDNVLPAALLEPLKTAFSPSSAFWSEHKYPTDEFFSYNVKMSDESSLMMQLIDHLTPLVLSNFPDIKSFKSGCTVEWWCHMRDESSGFAHQLHFDLDEGALREYNSKKGGKGDSKIDSKREGEVGLRNGLHPLVSAVLYLSEQENAAPTLVTDQTLDAGSVASEAWLCHPAENRLLLFDGKLLHGVVPFLPSGHGSKSAKSAGVGSSSPRITLMMGFWDKEYSPSPPVVHRLGPNMPMPTPSQQKLKTGNKKQSWPTLLCPVPLHTKLSNMRKSDNLSGVKKDSNNGLVHIPGPIWVPVGGKSASAKSSGSNKKSSAVNTDSDFISIADLNKLRGAPSVGISDDDDEEDEDDDEEEDEEEDDEEEVSLKHKSKNNTPDYGEAVEFISIAELNKLRSAPHATKAKPIADVTNSKKRKDVENNEEIVFVGKWFLKRQSDIRDDVLAGAKK